MRERTEEKIWKCELNEMRSGSVSKSLVRERKPGKDQQGEVLKKSCQCMLQYPG